MKVLLLVAMVLAVSCRERHDVDSVSSSDMAAVEPLTGNELSVTCGEQVPGGLGGGGFTSAGGGLVDDSSGVASLTQDEAGKSAWNEIVLTGKGTRMPASQITGYWQGANGVLFRIKATEQIVFEDTNAKEFDLRCLWKNTDTFMTCYGPSGGDPGVFSNIKGFNALKMNIQLPVKGQRSFGSGLLSVRFSQAVAQPRMFRYYTRTRELACDVH